MKVSKHLIKLLFLLSFLFHLKHSLAQLNAIDSLIFNQVFSSTKYVNDSVYIGKWYLYDSIQSVSDFDNQKDSIFKYSLSDFYKIDSMNVSSQFQFDTLINPTFNSYPFVYKQKDPLVYFDFNLNEKNSRTYSLFYPKDTNQLSKTAFLVIAGNGENSTSKIAQGIDYYNNLCYVANNIKTFGDVFIFMKPDEDARAIYWNNKKADNQQLVDQLDSLDRPYGLNYLIEIIATIKTLQNQYCKVMVLGISEGGYASLIASLITKPDASLVSAGYSVKFDNSPISLPILYNRFDSIVYLYSKDSIKNLIQNSFTKYVFTYGDLDAVNLMQAEHDFNYTESYFNDTIHCSFFYDYMYHNFPSCNAINQFLIPKISETKLTFNNIAPSRIDTLFALVSNCSDSCYNFDLYLNGSLYESYLNICGDTVLTLIDSGLYSIKNNIIDNSIPPICDDTILWEPISYPAYTSNIEFSNWITFNNPVYSNLYINNKINKPAEITILDMYGRLIFNKNLSKHQEIIDMNMYPSGIYFIKFSFEGRSFVAKVLKS